MSGVVYIAASDGELIFGILLCKFIGIMMSTSLNINIKKLAASRMLYSLGFNLLQPVLGIILLRQPFSFTLNEVALLITIFNFADRGLAVICTPIVEKINGVNSQILGFILAIIAIGAMLLNTSLYFMVCVLITLGFGYSLVTLGMRSSIAKIQSLDRRLMGFSDIFIASNTGAVIGLGSAFFLPYRGYPFATLVIVIVCNMLAACFAYNCANGAEYSDSEDGSIRQRSINNPCSAGTVAGPGYYILISTVTMFLYYQLYDVLPVYMEKTSTVPPTLGIIYALGVVLMIVFQRKITLYFKKVNSPGSDFGILLGILLLIVGSIAIGLETNVLGCWLAVICYSFASMMIITHIDYLLSVVCHEKNVNRAIGLRTTMAAVSRAVAAGCGISYLSYAQTNKIPVSLWWYFSASIAAMICIYIVVKAVIRQNFQRVCNERR